MKFQITHVSSFAGSRPATKHFWFKDGLCNKPGDQRAPRQFTVRDMHSMADFAEYLRGQTPMDATIYGIPATASGHIAPELTDSNYPDGLAKETRHREQQADVFGVEYIATTSKNFPYSAGPTIVTLDFDDMAEDATYDVIFDAMPELRSYSHVVASSTSSNISFDKRPVSKKRGLHVYYLIEDGRSAVPFVEALNRKLIAAGHISVTSDRDEDGVWHTRAGSPIDLQPVKLSGRSDYNGGAYFADDRYGRLTQNRTVDLVAGELGDVVPLSLIDDIDHPEDAVVDAIVEDALVKAEATIRAGEPDAKVQSHGQQGEPTIEPPMDATTYIMFRDGTSADAETVVANIDRYDGMAVACPYYLDGGETVWGKANVFKRGRGAEIRTFSNYGHVYPLIAPRPADKPKRQDAPKDRYSELSKGSVSDRLKAKGVTTSNSEQVEYAAPRLEDDLNDWCFLRTEGKFYNMTNGTMCSVQSFNLSMSSFVEPIMIKDKETGKEKEKTLPASTYLLTCADGVTVDGTMYRPDLADAFFDYDGARYVNSYIDAAPKGTARQDDIETLRSHIYKILSQEDADVMVKWMAHNVQHPGVKILWAPVLVGIEGDGKTTIMDMIAAALGKRHVQPVGPNEVKEKFNSWAAGSCVVGFEEIRVAGQNRSEVMNQLKPLITNGRVRVEGKGVDGKTVVNVTNYLAMTNFVDALAITNNDRRYGVMRTILESADDLTRLGMTKGYFDRIWDVLDNRPAAAREWLMSVDLTDFDAKGRAPNSVAKAKMVEYSESGPIVAIKSILAQGANGVADDVFAVSRMNKALQANGAQMITPKQWPGLCDALGFVKYDGKMKWEGEPVTIYYKPTSARTVLADEMLRQSFRRDLANAMNVPGDPVRRIDGKKNPMDF